MEITMDIPDDLAVRLQSRQDQLPQIIELGLRNLDATTPAVFPSASDRHGGLSLRRTAIAVVPRSA